jgi:hypothetical protein
MLEFYKNKKHNFYSIEFKQANRLQFELLLKQQLKYENDIYNILKIYDNVNTIKEFFQIIKDKIENKEMDFKKTIESWLEKFIKINMQFDLIFNLDIKWVINCNIQLQQNNYIIKELSKDPLPKWKNRYINIKQKTHYENQYGGMKRLEPRQKEYLKNNPNWNGWYLIDISEYNPKDQKYLNNLMKNNLLFK